MKHPLGLLVFVAVVLLSGVFLGRSDRDGGVIDRLERRADVELNEVFVDPLAGLPDDRNRVAQQAAVEEQEAPSADDPTAPKVVDVKVTVIDHAGRPLAAVRVGIAQPRDWGTYKHYRSLRTDVRGEVRFAAFPVGAFWVEVDPKTLPENYIRCARTAGRAEGPGEETMTLTCPQPGSLEGRVLRPDGTPLATGEVWLRPIEADSKSFHFKVNDLGRFYKSQLAPGLWSVSLRVTEARELAGLMVPYRQDVLVRPGLTHKVELRCPSDGAWILGRVVDQAGVPVSGLLVRAGPYDPDDENPTRIWGDGYAFATTDGSGAYRLGPLPHDPFIVEVGDRQDREEVSRAPVLLKERPDGFLCVAGSGALHETIIERVLETRQWRITPVFDPDAAVLNPHHSNAASWTAKVGKYKLTQEDGAWSFTTQRDLEGLYLRITNESLQHTLLDDLWDIELAKLAEMGPNISLPIPPPPALR